MRKREDRKEKKSKEISMKKESERESSCAWSQFVSALLINEIARSYSKDISIYLRGACAVSSAERLEADWHCTSKREKA